MLEPQVLQDVSSTSDDDNEYEPKNKRMKTFNPNSRTSVSAIDLSTSDDDEYEPQKKRIILSSPKAGTSTSANRKKKIKVKILLYNNALLRKN